MKDKDILEEIQKEMKKIIHNNVDYQNLEDKLDYFVNNYFDFKEIANHLFDGIYISDGAGKTLFINDAYTRVTGITKEEIIGKNVKDIMDKGDLYKGAVTLDVIREKKTINSIGKIVRLNKDVLVTGSPIFDKNGNVDLVVINNRDFSELKNLEEELDILRRANKKVGEEIRFLRSQQISKKRIICHSEKMKSIFSLIDTIAPTDVTVLITGESGTGKELVADEIVHRSDRRDRPFIKVNCAAIPGELLESELFGYVGGAFTDSKKSGKVGMFELANEGTILLDEIGDMPLKLQTKLLRVLQHKEITRLGSTNSIKLNLRIIASTNQNLKDQIRTGKFREDLYYRLNVVPLEIEPIRKRKDDIPPLIYEFLSSFCRKYNKEITIEKKAMEILINYPWPGNIRELENYIERIVVINTTGKIHIRDVMSLSSFDEFLADLSDYNLKTAVSSLEKRIITGALETFGSTRKAAKHLGIEQSTVVKKCKSLGIVLSELKK